MQIVQVMKRLCGIAAAEEGQRYEVTVTNLTRGQRFTPVLVATHEDGFHLFQLGQPASSQLKTLAEEGNTGPMVALLSNMPTVIGEVVSSPPPTAARQADRTGEIHYSHSTRRRAF